MLQKIIPDNCCISSKIPLKNNCFSGRIHSRRQRRTETEKEQKTNYCRKLQMRCLPVSSNDTKNKFVLRRKQMEFNAKLRHHVTDYLRGLILQMECSKTVTSETNIAYNSFPVLNAGARLSQLPCFLALYIFFS